MLLLSWAFKIKVCWCIKFGREKSQIWDRVSRYFTIIIEAWKLIMAFEMENWCNTLEFDIEHLQLMSWINHLCNASNDYAWHQCLIPLTSSKSWNKNKMCGINNWYQTLIIGTKSHCKRFWYKIWWDWLKALTFPYPLVFWHVYVRIVCEALCTSISFWHINMFFNKFHGTLHWVHHFHI